MAVATKLKAVSYVYIDVNSNYGTGDPLLLADIDAVNGQIYNLFCTLLGEADYEPLLGAELDYYLFDPNSATTATEISMMLYNALSMWLSSRIYVSPGGLTVTRDTVNHLVVVGLSYSYILLGVTVNATYAIPTVA